jgi:hypothetical protein
MSSSGITDRASDRPSVKVRVQEWLARRSSTFWIVALGLLLTAPTVCTGLVADDYIQAVALRHLHSVAPMHGDLDLFRFADGNTQRTQALMDVGEFPWFANPTIRFSFWRPLSALTHVIDYAAWPNTPWLMHVHNLVWFAVALFAVSAVYRRFLGNTWVAGLALLLFAVDDAHGPAVGWVADRNAILALAVALPVLLLHDRWRRDGWMPGAWIGPVVLGVALLTGESALAICAYLAAYALHLDRGSWRTRLASLAPYAVVVVVWRTVYKSLGYGVSGSGVYIDPAREPLAFLTALPARLPILLLGQLGVPSSDFASLYPFIASWLPAVMVVVAVCALAFLAYAMWPLLKRDPVARFFATGLLLAAIPVCATFPGDRLLLFVGLGGMGLVAQLFGCVEGKAAWTAVIYFTICHLVIGPALLLYRTRTVSQLTAQIALGDDTIPRTPDVVDKTVVIVNPPDDLYCAFIPIMRTALGVPRPARFRVLASSTSAEDVTRIDANTVRIHPATGFLEHDWSKLLRDPARPLKQGDVIHLAGLTITIADLTPDGRPSDVLFHFDVPVDDPSLLWLAWSQNGYTPWKPPPIDATAHLEAHDFIGAMRHAAKRAGE